MSVRHIIVGVAIAAIAPVAMLSGAAQAAPSHSTSATSSITVKVSDKTPRAGQTFRISGLFTLRGKPANHGTVKAQEMFKDKWVQLKGAIVQTNSTGQYGMRLILSAKGDRDLRVVGVVSGPQPNVFKRFSVMVH